MVNIEEYWPTERDMHELDIARLCREIEHLHEAMCDGDLDNALMADNYEDLWLAALLLGEIAERANAEGNRGHGTSKKH